MVKDGLDRRKLMAITESTSRQRPTAPLTPSPYWRGGVVITPSQMTLCCRL